MRTKHLLTKTLLAAVGLLAGASAWAQVKVPTPVYFNDFTSTEGLTIVGNGEFITDADPVFGKVFHNDPANASAKRTNYLRLPNDVLSHSATSNEMTIGFWVNKKGENNFFFTPLFAAYGAAPTTQNTTPMFVCETRGLIQLNCSGYCDFGINSAPAGSTYNDGTPYVNTAWLDDGAWHYYTVVLTATTAKVYIDGELKNGWTVDGTSDGQVISGLFTSGSTLDYVTLGGNQAWTWDDPDPAFAFDDFAVYDAALSAEQIAKIISDKGKAASTYNITYDFKSFVEAGTTSGYLAKNSDLVNNQNSNLYYPTTYTNEFGGKIAMGFSTPRWSISNTESDKGLIWNQGADEPFSILGLKAGDKVTINTTSGTIYFSTVGNCSGVYYTGTKYADDATGIPVQWAQLVSGNTYTILSDGQLNLQAKRNNQAAGRAQKSEKLVISSIVITPSQAETVSAPEVSSVATDGGRNVTITSGSSSMLSGVTTYYTTDGSTPTSSSTKYTGTFLQTTTATVKAITISNSSAATASTVTEQEVNLDVVDEPVLSVTGASDNSRIVTITCATDGATIYYSETEKANTDEGWSTYSAPVTTAATTLYAYAGKGTTKSDVVNIATGAGTTIQLDAPAITFKELELVGKVYRPVYTFAAPQTVLGTPTATVTYSFDTSTPAEGTSYTATAAGTLTVTASADGYSSKSTELVITNVAYGIANTYDLSDADYVDVSDAKVWGTGTASAHWANFSTMSATKYQLPATNSLPGITFSSNTNSEFFPGYGIGFSSGTRTVTVTGAEAGQIGEFVLYTGGSLDDSKNASEFVPYSSGISFTMPLTGTSKALKKIVVYQPIPTSVSKTITAAGWATYCSPYALDFSSSITNLTKAYLVTGNSGNTLTLTPITTTVPANTGILLEGSGEVNIPVVASSTTDVSGNKLVGVTASEKLTAEGGYVLMNESAGVGFYKNNKDFTLGANTAYLPADFDATPAPFYLFVDGDVTAIDAVKKTQQTEAGVYYNIAGQRVAQPTKGLYIVNGKKVVIK